MQFYFGVGALFHLVPALFLTPRAVSLGCPFRLEMGEEGFGREQRCSPLLPVFLPFRELWIYHENPHSSRNLHKFQTP